MYGLDYRVFEEWIWHVWIGIVVLWLESSSRCCRAWRLCDRRYWGTWKRPDSS